MKALVSVIVLIAVAAGFLWYTYEPGPGLEKITEEQEPEPPLNELDGKLTIGDDTPTEPESEQPPVQNEQPLTQPPMQEPTDTNLSFTTTSSGLVYAVITEGDGATRPAVTDTVRVHYHGTLEDGSVFDSSVERGQSIEFPLQNLIPGWQEGIPLMSVGSTYKFIIPPALAYGPEGSGHPLAGKTLTFDVELLGIK